MPKVPKQDFKKLMENDGIQLRYLAKFVNPQIEDKDRRFIITYWLNNDTVSVFEKFERNSGFIGGKFFERARAKNPVTGEYFQAGDFSIGKVIEFNKHKFEVIDGDSYTLDYMKRKAEEDSKRDEAAEEKKKERRGPKINPFVPVTAGFVSAATANMYGTASINPKIASPKQQTYTGPNPSVFQAAASASMREAAQVRSPGGASARKTTLGAVLSK